MVSTPTRSTVATIANSPPLRNIRRPKAEATVKKLNVENTFANFWPTFPLADSSQQPATKKTTMVDLIDTSDEPQQSPTISINPNWSSLGQDIIILSSDSQDSSPSFHTASAHSAPTQTFDSKKHTTWTVHPLPRPRTGIPRTRLKWQRLNCRSLANSAQLQPPRGGMWWAPVSHNNQASKCITTNSYKIHCVIIPYLLQL